MRDGLLLRACQKVSIDLHATTFVRSLTQVAGGLGDTLVQDLLSRDINVIAAGLNASQLEYLKPSTTAKLEKIILDVTSPSSISAAVRDVDRITNGRLSYLINNAGFGYMMPLMDADINKVKQNFDVNVFGLLAVTQSFFPMLRAAKGTVVNQASIAGLPGVCQPFIGTYSASKTAVVDLSNTMRVELAPFGIKVRCALVIHIWESVKLILVSGLDIDHRRRKNAFLGQRPRRPRRHSRLITVSADQS